MVLVLYDMPKKSNVICFRLGNDHLKIADDQFTANPVVGVQSLNKLIRKQVIDVLEGRAELVYANEEDRKVDREQYPLDDSLTKPV